jgi:TonB-dependent receptor
VYLRNPDGSFAHDRNGNRVRKPEAGTAGSLEELRVTLFERAARARRTYDGFYPSLHLTYNLTGNLLARAAYARTYGRPNLNQIIPNATINDFDVASGADPGAPLGSIEIRNPALRPWKAENYDVSLEYYTDRGGLFSAGFFRKNIDGFFQRRIKIATAEDLAAVALDARYVGYQVNTTYNLGRGHTTGVELSARQALGFLGTWGRWFEAFANTSLVKEVADTHGKTINAGLTFRRKPITLQTKVNYRGENRGATVAGFGPDAYQYEGARTTVDVNVIYLLSPRLSLFASSSNALNDDPSADRRGSQTPEYARRFREQRFGALYSLGVRGSF